MHDLVGKALVLTVFGERHGLAVEINLNRRSPIPGLLDIQGPMAIAGLVVAVFVFALDRMLGCGLGAHVFNEALEPWLAVGAIQPAITDGDAAPTIPIEALGLWIVAALLEPAPRPRQWVSTANAEAMGGVAGAPALDTAARSRFAISQAISSNHTFLSAVTDAIPA